MSFKYDIMKFRLVTFTSLFVFVSLSSLISAQELVFEDHFEGTLKPGWAWQRENATCRRFVNNALEILAEPFGNCEARNALVRPLNFFSCRDGRICNSYRIETKCCFVGKPRAQFQQCGVYWIRNERIIFKLVFENIDGKIYVFPGKVPVNSHGGRLRITVAGQSIVAEFCGDDTSRFRRVYEGRLDYQPNDKISLQCWNGPRVSQGLGQWARFTYFRVEKLD